MLAGSGSGPAGSGLPAAAAWPVGSPYAPPLTPAWTSGPGDKQEGTV